MHTDIDRQEKKNIHKSCGASQPTERKYTADSRHNGFWVIARETDYDCDRKKAIEIDGGGRHKKRFLNLTN